MIRNLISLTDNILISAHAKLLSDTLDVESLLNADGASEAFSGVNATIDAVGSSSVRVTQKVGLFCTAFGILGLGITLLVHGGNVNKRAEVKDSVPAKMIGAICVFGFVAIVGLIQTLGSGLFSVSK